MRNEGKNSNQTQIIYSAVLILCIGFVANGQTPNEPQLLLPEQTLERELTGAETHRYKVDLQKDEFFQVRVEQKGVDVALKLSEANGNILVTMDSPNSNGGWETLSFIAATAGSFVLEVVCFDAKAGKGVYTIRREISRNATTKNKRRVEVEQLFIAGMTARDAEGQSATALKKMEEALAGWHELQDDYLTELTAKQVLQLRDTLKKDKRDANVDEALKLFEKGTKESLKAALLNFEKAQMLSHELGQKEFEVICMAMIGKINSNLGNRGKALEYLIQALPLWKDLDDKVNEALTLKLIGEIYMSLGENQKALQYYQQALPLFKGSANKVGECSAHLFIGMLYMRLSNMQEAIKHFDHALLIIKEARLKNEEAQAATTLINFFKMVGSIVFASGSGENFASPDDLNKALSFSRVLGNKSLEAMTLFAIGLNSAKLGGTPAAVLAHFNQSLLIFRQLGDKKREADLLKVIAAVHLGTNEHVKAVDNFNQAFALYRLLGDKSGEANTLDWLMKTWKSLNSSNVAVFYGKQSVNKYQELRQAIQELDRATQQTYLKLVEDTYRNLADILIAEGRIAEAEQVLAMLKEEEVFSYLRRDDKVARELLQTVSLTEREREALKRYDEFADKITAIGKEFGELDTERKKYDEGQFTGQVRYDELKKQLADSTTTFQKFLDELKTKFEQTDERVVQIDSSLQNTLKRLKANRTAVVSTIVDEHRLNIIVTTANTQRAHTIDINRKAVNVLVAEFRQALTDPNIDPRPAGQKLYDVLVKPIEADLSGIKADTILWSLDGTLRYIPTAALWDAQNGYLAERFASAVLTLASRDTLALPVSDKHKWSALGVGVSKSVEGFSALTAVPDELDCIITDAQTKTVSLTPICQNGVMTGRKLLDEKFTLTAFENSLGRFSIVHIASHFSLNPGNDKDSFLLLGGGEQRRYTVENLRGISLTDVELIVLSACNTATPGGEKTNGVEIEGFGAVAQKQGAKAVLATLWSVADASTRDLMVKFYKLHDEGKLSKAESIRQAQLSMVYGKYKASDGNTKRGSEIIGMSGKRNPQTAFKKDDNAPFAHPYYWSSFILLGNWK